MENKSLSKAFFGYIGDKLKNLREWFRPIPEDPVYLKIVKGIFKSFALLIMTILSPVILLILAIAFFAAF
jgi:hypothetical protein